MLKPYENYWELKIDIHGEDLQIDFGSLSDAEKYLTSLGYIEKGMSGYYVKDFNSDKEMVSVILKKTLWRLEK